MEEVRCPNCGWGSPEEVNKEYPATIGGDFKLHGCPGCGEELTYLDIWVDASDSELCQL